MPKTFFRTLFSALICVGLMLGGTPALTQARVEPKPNDTTNQLPQQTFEFPNNPASPNQSEVLPLPHGGGGPVPGGENCCMVGLVWFDGKPVAGAQVTIQGTDTPTNTLTTFTQVFAGTDTEARPYFRAPLFALPVSATVGQVLVITARYSGFQKTITHTVLAGDQQVDITLPRPSPLALGFAGNVYYTPPPTQSLSGQSSAIAVGPDGTIYVGELSSARIVALNATGNVLRTWGSFGSEPGQFTTITGIAVDTSNTVYVADTRSERISKFATDGTLLKTWSTVCLICYSASINVAISISGTVLVGYSNGTIQEFDTEGRRLSTRRVLPDISGGSGHPFGFAVDKQGFVYVGDRTTNRVHKLTRDLQEVTNEAWTSTIITYPMSIAIDDAGEVFVLTALPSRIYRLTSSGFNVFSVDISSALPYGLAFGNNTFYVADPFTRKIERLTHNLAPLPAWQASSLSDWQLIGPRGMTFVPNGDLFVADTAGRIARVRDNAIQKIWGRDEIGFGNTWSPVDLAIDGTGRLFTVQLGGSIPLIQRMSIVSDSVMLTRTWGFSDPNATAYGIAINPNNQLFVVDGANRRLYVYQIQDNDLVFITATQTLSGSAPGLFETPVAIAADANGNVYVADRTLHRVQQFAFTGSAFVFSSTYGTLGNGLGEFNNPYALKVGPNGNVFVVGGANGKVTEVAFGAGGPSFVAEWAGGGTLPGEFLSPVGLALDAQGKLFVAQDNNITPPIISRFEPMRTTAPNATLVQLSANAGALQPSDVMTAAAQAQTSDISRTIALYAWTVTSTLLNQSRVFTTTTPQIVISATRLFTSVQRISLHAQDSAGEWSASVQSPETIYVAPTPETGCAQPRWVMMIYGASDNAADGATLLSQMEEAREHMEQAKTPNPCVYVAMQLDGPASIFSAISDTVRWRGSPGTAFIKESVSEQEMDNPQTLTNFVVWAQGLKPAAQHFYLSIADHGQALIGTAFDSTTDQRKPVPAPGASYLTTAEIAAALTDPRIRPIDILHLDSCSMALLDVAYELRNAARYLISSQYIGWSLFAYDDYAAAIGITTTAPTLAGKVVDGYANLAETYRVPYTLSALDQHAIGPAKAAWDGLAVLLRSWVTATTSITETEARRVTLRTLRDGTAAQVGVQLFNSNADFVNTPADVYVDAVDWALQLRSAFTQSEANQSIRTAAQQFVDAVTGTNKLVIALRAQSAFMPTPYCKVSLCFADVEKAHGISVFYPTDAVAPLLRAQRNTRSSNDVPVSEIFRAYTQDNALDLTRATRWDEYLGVVLPAGAGGELPVFAPLSLKRRVFLPVLMR